MPQIVSHVEVPHEMPGHTDYLRMLGRFARVATFDKRGRGMSDRTDGVAPVEEQLDDLVAVMDAVGMDRAGIIGKSERDTLGVAIVPQLPERVSHVVGGAGGVHQLTIGTDGR